MVQTLVGALRRPIFVVLVCSGMLLIGVGQGPARASHTFDFTAVKGSAYGYSSNVSFFNQPSTAGPTPTVTLPPGGSSVPITATAPTGNAQHGPASIFTTGPLNVSTQGSTGPSGPVTSSADILNVNRSGQEVFTAARLTSACTATGAGASVSATITNGTLQTDSGDADPANGIPDHAPVNVPLPANPAPNTPPVDGHIHINNTTDNFRYAFNEQFVNPNGSITVNAAHQYFLGPTAVGDLFIGQSACGATGTPIAHVAAPGSVPGVTAPQGALDSAAARSPAEGLTNCAATVTVGSDGTARLCDATNPPTASTTQTLTATLPSGYAEAAKKKKRRKPKPGPVATGQTTIPAGQTVPVTVRLTAKAVKALRKKGALKVQATIEARGVDGQTATVTPAVNLKPAKQAKRRKKR